MTVYFIRRLIDGAVKIGFTDRDPMQRLREIQNATGLACELVWSSPGGRFEERELHGIFSERRLYGEWFHCDQDMLDMIQYFREEATTEGRNRHLRERQEAAVAELIHQRTNLSLRDSKILAQDVIDTAVKTA